MSNKRDQFEIAHPYLVAKELAVPHNSLTALIMAAMIKADGPALKRLTEAFPEIYANLISYSKIFDKRR